MNNPNQAQNIEAITCYISPSHYIISYVHPHRAKTLSQHLKIDRKTQQMSFVKKVETDQYKKRQFSAFLGVVQIMGQKFVLVCQQSKKASNLDKMQTYEISSLDFLGYQEQKDIKETEQWKDVFNTIRDYYIILKDGFYFSHQYNLTLSLPNQDQDMPLNFVWNRQLFTQFNKYKISQHWKTPIIQGFVSSFELFYQGAKIKYMLITRRSTEKGGTRYFDRGVNDEGDVANFCETQQIIKIDQYVFSDLQIRGSLPIFFQQVGLYTKTKVNRGFEISHQTYKKHMDKIIKQYKRVFMVNLLSCGKRGEKMLTQQIENHIKADSNQNLKYHYYDFHHEVKGSHFENVDGIIQELKQMKLNLGYFIHNTLLDKVLSKPQGVFRTNCLDCLDRTNFFQAKLAIITLENIFKQLDLVDIDLLNQMRSNKDNPFIKKFRHIWADNGDAVSWHYTGTGSTHTDITRHGTRGFLGNFKHKYKSVTRFYNQNFWDFYKMKIVNLLLGSNKDLSQLNASHKLKQRETQFVQTQQIGVYIFTWKAPKSIPSILNKFPTDVELIVVSIQDLDQEDKWNQVIMQALDRSQYVKIDSQCVSDNYLSVFVKSSFKNRISEVQTGSIKFRSYYNTFISNKSANFIRFSVDQSKLVFVGCQLEKGRQFMDARIKNLKKIHQYAFQVEAVGLQKSQTILFDDAIFLIGNMNTKVSSSFRSEFSKMNVYQKQIPKSTIKKMIATDEFEHIRMGLLQYRVYEQEPINFLPTYKFSNGVFDPDHSGWPDRIWFSSQNKIKCQYYDVVKQLRQEHVPVVGRYTVQVRNIDEEQQEKIGEEIIKEEDVKEEDQAVKLEEDEEDTNIPI